MYNVLLILTLLAALAAGNATTPAEVFNADDSGGTQVKRMLYIYSRFVLYFIIP